MKKVSVSRMIFLMGLYAVFANLVHPVSPAYYTQLGCHDYIFGVAMAAMSLTNFLFAPFWGKMMDRYGCARITGFCLFGYAFAQFIFASVTTELGIALARLLAGVFISAIIVSQMLYVMRYSPSEKAPRNLMYMATTIAVISPAGYLIGGVLGDYSIKASMMAQVAGLTLLGVLFLLFLDDEKTEQAPAVSGRELLSEVNPLKSFGEIRPYMNALAAVFFVIAFLTHFSSTCYEQSFNYLIKAEYGFPPSYNGYLKALVGIVALVSNLTVSTYLLRKTNVPKSTVGVLAICAVMSVGIVLIKAITPFIVINVVFFGFNSVYLPLLQSTLAKLTNKGTHGIFVGMFNAMRSVGMVCGSLAAGFAYTISSRLPFVITALLFAVSVVFAVINYKQHELKNSV
ncbi:MAG: MFS transporter [Bacillota bacterium]|nr:MFS transporter [Bacillota bacterium]